MMKTLLSLFIAVIWLSGVQSAEQLTQSDPAVIKPGDSYTLTCTASGFTFSSHWMSWARQIRGKLQWIGDISTDASTIRYHDDVKGRFTISRDNNNNMLNLKMDNMKTEDTAVYYCARWMYIAPAGGYYFDVWGQGTMVTVTSDDLLTPEVFPLIASGQEGNSYITMACMTQKYFPSPVTVNWSTTSGEILSGEKNIEFPLSGDPFSYNLVTQITVSSSEWNCNSYICGIKHNSSNIQKVIPRSCGAPPNIAVEILQGTFFNKTSNQIELSCQAYNLASQDATIKWFINEKERLLTQNVRRLGKSDENLYGLQSTINIFQGEWNNGARIKCQVTDTKTGKSSYALARKHSESTNILGIEVTMAPPTIDDLYVQNTAHIACVANNLRQSTGYSFSFDYPGAPVTKQIQTEDPQMSDSGMYTVISILTVSPETWQLNTEFTCIFKFTELSNPIIRTISKRTETKLIAPSISVFPPSPEDLAKNERCTLTCTANGFYPVDIYMGWTENEMVVFKDQYVNSKPNRNNENQSFSASSLLSIPCGDWIEGMSYSCVLGHEANAQKFARKSIDKYSGKPAKVNVSVIMSDTTLSCM